MILIRKYVVIVLLIVLALVSVTYLDIGLKSSITSSDSSVSAYSSGNKTDLSSDIILYVHQQNANTNILEKELVSSLEEYGYSVTVVNEIKDDYASQFAFVNIVSISRSYTPVYSSSDSQVRFGFSSTGETKYLDITGKDTQKTVVFSSNDGYSYNLLIRGDITLHDKTKGLFTYRSYQNHIEKEIAKSVASQLDSQLRAQMISS
ncbi:MAG: hypothetical protein PWQ44_1888 [Methanolobus sp.]|nr:hypothetical protein [Methanolobus sp.]